MKYWQVWVACGLLMSLPAAAQADIFRWDNGQLIPGTEGITPGPATQLGARVLQFAELSNTNLTGSSFYDNVMLHGSDLTGARFTNANLSYTVLTASNLTGADFTGATVIGTYLWVSQGFTKEQLYSTASYQAKDLHEIGLGTNLNLTGWELSGQDLTGAAVSSSTLTNTNLAGADLTNAYFDGATLTNTNLTGAIVRGANFSRARGFTKELLYSTASYQQRNLRDIVLSGNDVTGWDFSGQDLAGANFSFSVWSSTSSTLTNANFSFADLRGAQMPSGPFQTRNTIREGGAIIGLDLAAGETLVVRDSDIGITVNDNMNAVSGGTLELVLGDADWGSTMAVAANITPDLGGTLRVRFADQADLAPLLGKTFDFFDWPAALDTNNRFDAIELPPGTQWDFSQLYMTGTATLTAIPEPSAVLLLACGTAAWILGWASRQRRHARAV